MNGQPLPQIMIANPLLEMIELMAAEIKAGRISSLALIAVTTTGGVATPFGGPQMCELHTGAALLQKRVLNQIEAPQAGPRIIPAGAVRLG